MKSTLKLYLFLICVVALSPLLAITIIQWKITRKETFFQGASQLLSLIPFKLGTYFRAAFYASVCKDVDREVAISFLTLLSHIDTDIGRNVYIGPQSNIGSCSVGSDCVIGSGVHILSGKHQHDFSSTDQLIRKQGGEYEKIQIGEDCWIGNHATILATVGAHCVVAAGSVVVNEVPERSIVAGNPARILKSR